MLPLRAAIGILGSEREKGLYDSVVKGRSKFIKYIPIILIGFFISALYVYLMSFSTSPLFPYYFGGDSAPNNRKSMVFRENSLSRYV